MRILVSGKNSQIGRKLFFYTKDSPHNFYFLDSNDMDLTDPEKIKIVISDYKPNIVINLSAYTDVDGAEKNIDKVEIINSLGPKYIAQASNSVDAYFIQISTDYVFGKNSFGPYSPYSNTGPLNAYGLSKLKGEENALYNNKKSLIIRTSSLFSEYGNNFVKLVAKKLIQNEHLKVISDQTISMTYVDDFVEALLVLLDKKILDSLVLKETSSIIHYTNDEYTTWFDVANEILKNLNNTYKSLGTITPIPYSEWSSEAIRPKDSRLLIDYSLLSSLNIKLKPWKPQIKKVLSKINFDKVD